MTGRRLPFEPPTPRSAPERLVRSQWLRAWLSDPDGVRPGELPPDITRWPEDWRFAWEERVALMEHHGGLPRDRAEREAERCVREAFARDQARGPPAGS